VQIIHTKKLITT